MWENSLPPLPRFKSGIYSGRSIPIKNGLCKRNTVFENQWNEGLPDSQLRTSNEVEMYTQSARTFGVQDIQRAVCRLCRDHLN